MQTPNGLKPTQSWHCVGISPEGDIFVGGMNHLDNAALYRIEPSKGTLRYVGDARAATKNENNLQAGDMIEKFHTRPPWHNSSMYVSNMNRSYSNGEYLGKRGFHWFAYDINKDPFLDLSAIEPGGAAVDHVGIVSLTSDLRGEAIYGGQEPHGKLYKFYLTQNKTTDLGRPIGLTQKYVYTLRVMWVDSRNRLYWGMGKAWYFDDNTSVTDHMHVYDPRTGWSERKDWKFTSPIVSGKYDAMEVGQWIHLHSKRGNHRRFGSHLPHCRKVTDFFCN